MRYETPAALEMAVREAAKASPLDTGRAISGFYFHRLLCRVFANGNASFVLKGGQGMLARTIDARATCDIDLLSAGSSLGDAPSELRGLAEVDLGDFVTFEFAGGEPHQGRGRVSQWAERAVHTDGRRQAHVTHLDRPRGRRGSQ